MSITLEDTRYLFVSSANRSSGTNSRFTIYLPSSLISNYNNKQKYLKVSMYDINIPREWYDVQSGINNQFIYFDGTDTFNIEIPEGNYSVYTLKDYLNATLVGYTITYDATSNKYTFSTSEPTATITSTNAGALLGLIDLTTYTGTFTSIKPVNMSIYSMLYLNTDMNSTDTNLDNLSDNYMDASTILDSVPIIGAPWDNMYYESINPSSFNVAVNGTQLSAITLYLTTDTGVVLDKIITPWCVTLQLEVFTREG